MFVVWPPLCIRGDEARGGLARSSIVKTARSDLGEAISETHLRAGKARALFAELPDRDFGPCEDIIARGSNKD